MLSRIISAREDTVLVGTGAQILRSLNKGRSRTVIWKDLSAEGCLIQGTDPYISFLSQKKGEEGLRMLSQVGDIPQMFLFLPHVSLWISLTRPMVISHHSPGHDLLEHVCPDLNCFQDDPIVHVYYYEPSRYVRSCGKVRSMHDLIRTEQVAPLKAVQLERISLSLAQLIPMRKVLLVYLSMVDRYVQKSIMFNMIEQESKLTLKISPKHERERLFPFMKQIQEQLPVLGSEHKDVSAIITSFMRQHSEAFSRSFPGSSLNFVPLDVQDRLFN